MTTPINKNAKTALLAVQTGLFVHLNLNLDCGVYDYAPETAPYPFVTIGEATELPDNTFDNFGREVTVTIHIWTQGTQGFVDALEIADQIQSSLDHQNTLSVTGHRVIVVKLDQVLTMRDPDPTIRHVPMRFRIFTEQE